jgi:hypothetical protein
MIGVRHHEKIIMFFSSDTPIVIMTMKSLIVNVWLLQLWPEQYYFSVVN